MGALLTWILNRIPRRFCTQDPAIPLQGQSNDIMMQWDLKRVGGNFYQNGQLCHIVARLLNPHVMEST